MDLSQVIEKKNKKGRGKHRYSSREAKPRLALLIIGILDWGHMGGYTR
jgi:hypothetical protein